MAYNPTTWTTGDVITADKLNNIEFGVTNASSIAVLPETLTNLDAIESKYPNGSTGPMVASDNGHKYIWANNVWTDAGVYQSVGIADGSITWNKLNDVTKRPKSISSMVGFAIPGDNTRIDVSVTDGASLTLSFPTKIYVNVPAPNGDNAWSNLKVMDAPTLTIPTSEYVYIDVDNLTIGHGTLTDLKALTSNYLIVGYNSYGYLTGPWGIYQDEKIQAINSTLSAWVYPAMYETVTITAGEDPQSLTVSLPSTVITAANYAAIKSADVKDVVKRVTLKNDINPVILANNQALVLDSKADIISAVTYTELNENSSNYILLAYNHYGRLKGPWAVYQSDTGIRRNTMLASWAYPTTSETVVVASTGGTSLNVTLPSALEVATDFNALNVTESTNYVVNRITLKNANQTLTLPNNSLLVLDVEGATVNATKNAEIVSNTDHTILLGINHYGRLKGPWSIYQKDRNINGNNSLPEHYFVDNYIDDKIATINQNTQVETGGSFVYFTDLHWGDNAGNAGKLINYITERSSIEKTFFGGDIPQAYGSQATVEAAAVSYKNLAKSLKYPVYGIHGNHDLTIRDSAEATSGYTSSQIFQYDTLMRTNEVRVTGVQNKNYYYIDNPIQKIRYVVIDDWEGLDTTTFMGVKATISQEQLDWMLNKAFTGVDGYTFVVFTHAPSDATMTAYAPTNAVVQQLLIAINNKAAFAYDANGINGTADFTATTNHVAIHICGHNHRDQNHVEQGVLSVSSMSDALYNDDPAYTQKRTRNTINEQCVNIVSVDTTARTVKICRVGAGDDQEYSY